MPSTLHFYMFGQKDADKVKTIHVNKSEFKIINEEIIESVLEHLVKQDERYNNDIVKKFINIKPRLETNYFITDLDDPSLVYF